MSHHPRATKRALVSLALGSLAVTSVSVIATGPASAVPNNASTVFINEIHYDNDGADADELVEVAGPAGTDLSGWSVVLYNGSNGTTYGTVPLSGTLSDAQGGYGVASVAQAGLQNGSPDGVALVNGGGSLVQFLSYEGAFAATNGAAAGQTSTDIGVEEAATSPVGSSLQLTGTGLTYGDFTWAPAGTATAGQPNTGQTFGEGDPDPDPDPIGDCGDDATLIHDIQGSGDAFDPAFGGEQVVEGVVTDAVNGGIFVQEEAADVDPDPETSEGIFVFLAGEPAPAVDTLVRVAGTPVERFEKTQIATVTEIKECGVAPAIAPTPVSFPLEERSDLEHYEGMLVKLVDELVISEYFNYDRFGEVVVGKPLDGQERLFTPTSVVEPGAEAQALTAEYAKRTLTIDDRNGSQNPMTIPHPGNGEPFSLTNRFRGGDTITGIEGILDYDFSLYRLLPTTYGSYVAKNPRPTTAPAVGGDVQVASFNVLNYFLTLDRAGAPGCGPGNNLDCRGANNENELERQRTKIIAAIGTLDADVVGLMEMENTPGVEPAADLVEGLNDEYGAGTYDYIDTGVIGTDAIRLGFLYQPGAVQPVGDFDILDSSDDPAFDDQRNRPMLTQTFDAVAGAGGSAGERFTVSVNHLKSKGSACGASDPDTGDGQGNCNLSRTAAAEAIVEHLATDPTASGDRDHLVIGDLNSYDHEDPIRALEAGGYVDQVKRFGGELAYGYVFDGLAGYLDHALANRSLTSQVTGTSEWHVNADEPDILDYNTDFGRPTTYFAPDAYRASDHDAVLVGLELASTGLEIKVGPKKIEAGKTRATVEVKIETEDGTKVGDGLVAVRDGDRLLGALAPDKGKVKIELAPFAEAGEVTLTVSYEGGSAPEASEEVTVTVLPAKQG